VLSLSLRAKVVAVLAVALTLESLLLTPRVDEIRALTGDGYPFFYASHLPVLYYLTAAFLIAVVVWSAEKALKYLALACLAFLVEMSPIVLLVNPFVPDQYPFIAEPTWLALHGHLADLHYLGTTPGLGLVFSQLLLTTGFTPLQLSKFFPILSVVMVLIVAKIGDEIGLDASLFGVPAVLFLGFNYWYQTDIFHRQTFSLIFYLLSLYLIVKILKSERRAYFIIYVVVYSAMVMSHPGTPVFLLISLVVATLGFTVIHKNRRLLLLTYISLTIFFIYYLFVNSWDLPRMFGYVYSAVRSLLGVVPSTPATAVLTGYGATFQRLLNIRLGITGLYLLLASLTTLYVLFKRAVGATVKLIAYIHIGLIVQIGIFVFGGYIANLRPLFFIVYTCALLVTQWLALVKRFFQARVSAPVKTFAKVTLLSVLVTLTCLVPVLRFSGIPYLYAPTQELSVKTFVDRYYDYASPIYATESNLPYFLAVLVDGNRTPGEPTPFLAPRPGAALNESYLLLYRFVTRDGYWRTTPTYQEFVEYLIVTLSNSPIQNLVYSSDQYYKVFLR
jgi:hypothetical protein